MCKGVKYDLACALMSVRWRLFRFEAAIADDVAAWRRPRTESGGALALVDRQASSCALPLEQTSGIVVGRPIATVWNANPIC